MSPRLLRQMAELLIDGKDKNSKIKILPLKEHSVKCKMHKNVI